MTEIGQRRSICPHCLADIPEPPMAWLPPWQCSHCGELYGFGRDRTFRVPKDFEPVRFLMTYQQAHYWASFNARGMSYVYALCYPTGLPFYIGKGTGSRLITHGKFVGERNPRDEKEEVIEQLQKMGRCEYYAVLVLDVSSDEALTEEAKFIIKCGRRSNGGMLTNRDEGYLVKEPENWDTPQQQPLDVMCVNPNRWVIHSEIQYRKPEHSGVAVHCPACDYQCTHPLGVKFDEVRCPHCFRGWRVDPDSVLALYRARELGTQEPRMPRMPKKAVAVEIEVSALAVQENPVENAVQQLVSAVLVEPVTQIVEVPEPSSGRAILVMLGFVMGLAFALAVVVLAMSFR